MHIRNLILAGTVALMGASPAMGAQAKLAWPMTLNETRGPIRAADVSKPLGKAAISEILGGPSSGSDNAYIIYTRMPQGGHGPALFTLPVYDYYVVLSGKMNVQIGTDTFTVEAMNAVGIPPATPHRVWNADGAPEANLEVISSADPARDVSRDLMAMAKPAKAEKVENAASFIHEIKVPAEDALKPGLNRQSYTNRAHGSPVMIALDSSPPASGGPKTHVHRFEQVYFVAEGEMTLSYGADTMKVEKNSAVILPVGVVHTNFNQGPAIERHITLLLPEPGTLPLDIKFEREADPAATAAGAANAGGAAAGGAGPAR